MMLHRHYFLLTMLLCIAGSVFAQKEKKAIRLNNGTVFTSSNILSDSLDRFNQKAFRQGKAFAIIQFDAIPSADIKRELEANGIVLLNYIPDYAYTASIKRKLNPDVLKKARARAILEPTPQQKMHPGLVNYLNSAATGVKVKSQLEVQIRFPQTFTATEVVEALDALKYVITKKDLLAYGMVSLQVPTERLKDLASLPFVEYVQEAVAQEIPLNQTSRRMSGANALNASIENGGKNLNGAGVVIGQGDQGNTQGHVDYTDRVISKTASVGSWHSTWVAGSLGGAGVRNELYRGYASKATMISAQYSDIWLNAATYVQDYGMVLTNNSYQIVAQTCAPSGIYDGYSAVLDQQAYLYPFLTQVFAAGNHGNLTCSPYTAPGFGTVAGSLQCAKNVITVGNITNTDLIGTTSCKGPVRDGRIKPELVALGTNVTSTSTNAAGYVASGGTSIAAPAVTGGAALLYERYRQLNGNANPPNALIKALLCNGATDIGNPGPDYTFGFGSLNLLRSIDMLEKGRFIAGSIGNGGNQTNTIAVPANTAQVKVMIYWNDPTPSLLTTSTLVNDLDLEVTDPLSAKVLPLVLDPSPAAVNNNSLPGVDHVNNIEQVVINNPTSGTYTLTVKGSAINQNPTQEYFIVYDIIPNSLTLTFPVGGEGLLPNQPTRIQWEAYGDPGNTFNLEFSQDGGTTWATIDNNISATVDNFTWAVPGIVTDHGRIRITKNGTSFSSSSNSFAIVDTTTLSLSTVQCPTYMAVEWPAVTNATDYEVMRLMGGEMVSVGITSGTSYTLQGLSPDSTYWVAVRARVNGSPGLRSTAISYKPSTGPCAGVISDNDIKLDAIIAPGSGRIATSTALTATTPVKVRIKNLDDAAVNNFTVKYSIDGGATWVSEAGTAPIAAQGVYEHTFSTSVNFSALGTYHLIAAVENNVPDPVSSNNTLSIIIKHLDNQPLDLTTDFLDDLETATVGSYATDTIGVTGIDRYDFINSTPNGRLRTFVNSGMAYSGSKAITLDADRLLTAPGNTNYLIGTFNLSSYSTADELRLGFKFNQHGQPANTANRVWIRGNDNPTTPWIEVYNLDNAQAPASVYKDVTSIDISDFLATNSQALSSSFQVRWGQGGVNQAVNRASANGFSFDDIRLYLVQNDMQVVSIDGLQPISCGLTAATPITVTIRNTVNTTQTNIPIKYRINGGVWVTEIIGAVTGNTNMTYTFATTANLSAYATYTIEVAVDQPGDSFAGNNSMQATFLNAPLITSFPYLQDFEADNGNWYATGINSSWAWGAPASININHAASGTKAWKTNLSGEYNNGELSFLYSPCFDVSAMTNPMLSFVLALDIEDCGGTTCDAAKIEYSTDGFTWQTLGVSGSGTNWYNRAGSQQFWSTNFTRWHVASIPLPKGSNRLRLRFVFSSDDGLSKEGIAIDDIHIFDKPFGIYKGATMASPVQKNITGGTSWIHFTQSSTLIASIQPNNQSLGNTAVQAYINTGAIRYTNNQYYANRNITIKPTNTILGSPVKIRFYFTDAEVQALAGASGCATCSAPTNAYQLGIPKFSHTDKTKENEKIDDNAGGIWSFISSGNVRIVPYDIGYYAEFEVNNFSEFWLSKGGLDGTIALPVSLISFTGQRKGNDALLKWSVIETDISKYEIEVALGNSHQFNKIGEVNSQGNSNTLHEYSFLDTEVNKSGTRYYRLKIIEEDGSFSYAPIRPVIFASPVTWQVYPNPSNGTFYLTYQLNRGEKLEAQVFDSKGRLIQLLKKDGTGEWQKFAIDLSSLSLPAGIYLLRVTANDKQQSFKLNKQ